MSLNLDKSAWTRVTFGDVIDSITDRVDNPSEAGVDRYVGLEHLDPGSMTVQRWDAPDKVEAQKLRFQPGDVIFGRRRAYQKKVSLADFEGICSAHALVLRARSGCMHPDFLPVFLSSDYFLDRAIAISVGSLSPTVNWRDLKVQEFDLPPLDEQRRIADLVWAVEFHRRALSGLTSALTGTQLRDGSAARTALLNHLLSRPNETWMEAPLGQVGTFTRGRRFTKEDYVEAGIGCVHYGHVYTHFETVATEPVTFLSETMRPSLRFAQPGNVIVAGTSENVDDVCKAVAWMGEEDVAVHDDCFVFKHGLDPMFASYLFASATFQQQKARLASETKVVRVSAANLAKVVVPVPPLGEQVRIVDAVDEVSRTSAAVQLEAARLDTTYAAVLADIFGGS